MDVPSLVFYGGSFDPPHQGHMDCIAGVLEIFPNTRLLMSPTPHPSGAFEKHKVPAADYEDRVQLCKEFREKAPRELRSRFTVNPIEKNLQTPNYTYKSLEAVGKIYDVTSLGLLIGEDQLNVFAGWKEPIKILQQASLIVVPRSREKMIDPRPDIIKKTREFCDTLSLGLHWDDEATTGSIMQGKEPLSQIHLVTASTSAACSRTIRAKYQSKEALPPGWIPPELEELQRSVYTKEILHS